VPGSVSDVKLPDEENLLNPDIDPEKIESSIGASCPACGATLIVPIGMSAICPYCGRKVVVGKDGSIR
jgi:DNA-directed RNA polymerase subunit RPC12/RpoP